MGNIQDLLAQILSARYGRDVRQSIHDAIETCYEDGHAGAIDLQAREDIAQAKELLGNTDISEISETVTGAVVELDGAVGTAQTTADGAVTAAQAAQSTADGKLSPEDAWKIAIAAATITVTVAAGAKARLTIPNPVGEAAVPLYARSADATRALVPVNLFAANTYFGIWVQNVGNETYSDVSMTIEVTYAYK